MQIRSQWRLLNVLRQEEIFQALNTELKRLCHSETVNNESKPYRNFLVMCICSICVRVDNGLSVLLDHSMEMFKTGQVIMILIGLHLICEVPREVQEFDCNHEKRSELESSLVELLPKILLIIREFADTAKTHVQLHAALLKATRAWTPFGISINTLFVEHSYMLELILSGVSSFSDDVSVQDSLAILDRVLGTCIIPKPTVTEEAISVICDSIVSASPRYMELFEANDEISCDIVTSIASIASNSVTIISSPMKLNKGMFELLLSICTYSREMAFLTFDFWPTVQDIPVAQRHPYTRDEVFRKLLNILFDKCSYLSIHEDAYEDDIEKFYDFRDAKHGIQDIFLLCFNF